MVRGEFRVLANWRHSASFKRMTTVKEIESAIEKLSDAEVAELKAWLWDRDIERDVAAGRLDAVAEEALDEHRSGKTRPL